MKPRVIGKGLTKHKVQEWRVLTLIAAGDRMADKIEALTSGRSQPQTWAWDLIGRTELEEAYLAAHLWRTLAKPEAAPIP